MTPDELRSIFRQVLKTSVPVVGLSLCGAKTPPPVEKKPLLSDALSDLSRAHSLGPCGSEADKRAQQDPNYLQIPVERRVVRRLTEARFEEWKKSGRNYDVFTCQNLCGASPDALAALSLSDGTLARVKVRRAVVVCLPAGKPHPSVTCTERWTITGTDCSPQSKLRFKPPRDDDKDGFYLEPGRRPHGWAPGRINQRNDIGTWLAHFAAMEAASVPAFETLHDDLTWHGAPSELAERALRFADDEVRHTRMMTTLARRFGTEPALPDIPGSGTRSLEDVIIENMVEGCVRETFAALVAHWQSTHATDTTIREAMTQIADDETRHAALAWDIHAWAAPLLSPEARRRVDKGKHQTVAELIKGACVEDDDVLSTLGLPDAVASSALAERLQTRLWA